MQILNIIGVIVVFCYIMPLSLMVLYSLAKDGFIETFKKLKNFNN